MAAPCGLLGRRRPWPCRMAVGRRRTNGNRPDVDGRLTRRSAGLPSGQSAANLVNLAALLVGVLAVFRVHGLLDLGHDVLAELVARAAQLLDLVDLPRAVAALLHGAHVAAL